MSSELPTESEPTIEPAIPPAGAYGVGITDPGRVAVVDTDGSHTTFGDLVIRANRLANALRGLGLSDGDVVAMLLHNHRAYIEMALAVDQVGLYRVPINNYLTSSEVGYILRDCGAHVLVAADVLAESLVPVLDELPPLRFVVGRSVPGWRGYADLVAAGSPQPPQQRRTGTTMGYTSGTTGRPKGVRRQLSGLSPDVTVPLLVQNAMAPFGLYPGPDVHLVVAPLYHAAPNAYAIGALHLGNTLVLHRRFSPQAFLEAVAEHHVTSAHLVPTHFHRLMALPEEVRAGTDTSSIEVLLSAAAPFSPMLKQAVMDWLGPVVWEYFASTEGMVCRVSPQEAAEHPGTVGKPADVKILDDDGQPVPVGEGGMIYFPTAGNPFTYHNDPEKTAAAIRPDGYATAGDYGRLAEDGYLYLLDRRVDLIITGGVNVYPAEIENALLEHPVVSDVAVVGTSDPEWGQTVVAVVEPIEDIAGGEALAAELEAHCRKFLTGAKIPRRFEFRRRLPRTESGKLLRREVREDLA